MIRYLLKFYELRPRKETQDIEIEVWSYEKDRFTQNYSNKKAEEKS